MAASSRVKTPSGRTATAAQAEGLEVVPRRAVAHRGVALDEMDLDAVRQRHPGIALVDELAHTYVPGSRNDKRWMDVEELLEAGIDVITTVNVQHIESLNDVVEKITGVVQRETVPDAVVRAADQIEVVDLAPQSLRDRLAAGSVYPAERIDAALSSFGQGPDLAQRYEGLGCGQDFDTAVCEATGDLRGAGPAGRDLVTTWTDACAG